MSFLYCGGHITKQMYVFSKLRLYKGRRKDVSSVAVLTDLENELNRSKLQEEIENTSPRHSLIVQMKRGKENLEREYVFLRLSFSFFRRRFKSTEWP